MTIPRYLQTLVIAKWLNKRVATWAVGVGPIRRSSSKYLMNRLMPYFDFISVRDIDSRDALTVHNVAADRICLVRDPALDLGQLQSLPDGSALLQIEGLDPTSGILLVSISPSDMLDQQIDHIAELVGWASREFGLRPVFMPFAYGDRDRQVIDAIRRTMAEESTVLQGRYSPLEAAAILKEARLVIASKLHAAVFASSLNRPVLILSYAPKVASFAKSVDLPSWPVDDIDVQACKKYLADAWKGRDDSRAITHSPRLDVRALLKVSTRPLPMLQKVCVGCHFTMGLFGAAVSQVLAWRNRRGLRPRVRD